MFKTERVKRLGFELYVVKDPTGKEVKSFWSLNCATYNAELLNRDLAKKHDAEKRNQKLKEVFEYKTGG